MRASKALAKWQTVRQQELDQFLAAHEKTGGNGPGRRYATEQLNHAYLAAVAAQFQGFCRDLHSEAVGALAAAAPRISTIIVATLTKNRRLDQMNMWRNAIAHNNFEQNQTRVDKLDGHLRPRLIEGARCRTACEHLAIQMEAAVSSFLAQVVGSLPW